MDNVSIILTLMIYDNANLELELPTPEKARSLSSRATQVLVSKRSVTKAEAKAGVMEHPQ